MSKRKAPPILSLKEIEEFRRAANAPASGIEGYAGLAGRLGARLEILLDRIEGYQAVHCGKQTATERFR